MEHNSHSPDSTPYQARKEVEQQAFKLLETASIDTTTKKKRFVLEGQMVSGPKPKIDTEKMLEQLKKSKAENEVNLKLYLTKQKKEPSKETLVIQRSINAKSNLS